MHQVKEEQSDLTACGHSPVSHACIKRQLSFCKKCFAQHKTTCVSSHCGDTQTIGRAIVKKLESLMIKSKLSAMGVQGTQLKSVHHSILRQCDHFQTQIIKEIRSKLSIMVYEAINSVLAFTFKVNGISPQLAKLQQDALRFRDSNSRHIKEDCAADLNCQASLLRRLQICLKNENPKCPSQNPIQDKQKNRAKLDSIVQGLQEQFIKMFEVHVDMLDLVRSKLNNMINNLVPLTDNFPSYNTLEYFKDSDNEPCQHIKYGLKCDIVALEREPYDLMNFSKNLFREQIYNRFSKKGLLGFPYSNLYVFCTTLTPNRALQLLKTNFQIKLVSDMVLQIGSCNSNQAIFSMTRRLIVMGPELLYVRFRVNVINNSLQCRINSYGQENTKDRTQTINEMFSVLGVPTQKKTPRAQRHIEFKFQSDIQKVYCFTRLVQILMQDDSQKVQEIHSLTVQNLEREGKQFIKCRL